MTVHPNAANLLRQMWPKNQREQKQPKPPKGLHRRTKSDPSRATRSAVKSRAQMRCERCTKDLTWEGGEIHHLKNRSQGGGNELTNLALLCLECHGWATTHPHAAHGEGYTLWHGEEPGSRPVLSQLHGPVWLLANGGVAPAVWPLCRACGRPLAPGYRCGDGNGIGPYHLVCADYFGHAAPQPGLLREGA